jgi:hypothetical protein
MGNIGSSGGGFNAIKVIKGDKVIKTVTPPAGVSIGFPAFTPNGNYAYVPEAYLNGSTLQLRLPDGYQDLPAGGNADSSRKRTVLCANRSQWKIRVRGQSSG